MENKTQYMEEQRKEYIRKKYSIEELFTEGRKILTKSECQEVIDETRLTKEDREIAQLWCIECLSYEEIAFKLGIGDKRTIKKRLEEGNKKKNTPSIRNCLKSTLIKIICAE